MSLSFIVVTLGAVVAAIGTGVLAARCVRSPGVHYVAWALATFGLAVALGAQMIGDLAGYDGLMFRAMEVGAQLVAPLALCLSLVELVGRSVSARFAMRLAVSAIAVIALVVLGTDPLSQNVGFTTTWPDPALYYQLAPKAVLEFLAPFALVTAAVAAAVTMARARRDDAAAAATRPVIAASLAVALLAVPGLALLAGSAGGVSLPLSGRSVFALACTGAAGLTWLAGAAAARLGRAGAPGSRRQGRGARPGDDWAPGDHGGTGEFDAYDAADRGARRFDPGDRGAAYRDEADDGWGGPDGGSFDDSGQPRYPGLAALAAGPDDGDSGSFGRYGGDDDAGRYDENGHFGRAGDYGDDAGHSGAYGADGGRHGDPHAPLFGQITIYTLIEDRTAEFDRLTEWLVGQVKEREPGTLAYIVHAVPTAPMQRILYEVYRDRAAYDDHLRRPYIARYEVDRRPLVLATNVIELGLQQAKVSAFPSFSAISDILSESGIDLTGVTRTSRGSGPDLRPGQDQPMSAPRNAQDGPWPDTRSAGNLPGPPRPVDQRPYQGWDEILGEDQRYR